MTKKEEWLAGARSAVPIMLGYVPVGIAYGVMARQAGLSTWQTVLMSLTVYGGASEMMAVGMVAQGAAVLTIVLTTFILNLRHIIMSTCVFNQMQGGRLPVRMLAAFGVTDETFAVYTTTANAPRTPRYFFSMVSFLGAEQLAGGHCNRAAAAADHRGTGHLAVCHVHWPADARPARQWPSGGAGCVDGAVQHHAVQCGAAGFRLGHDPFHAGVRGAGIIFCNAQRGGGGEQPCRIVIST